MSGHRILALDPTNRVVDVYVDADTHAAGTVATADPPYLALNYSVRT